MEGVAGAAEAVAREVDRARFGVRSAQRHFRQQPIVGPDEEVVLGCDHDRGALRANARIDHRAMHASVRKIAVAALQPERALGDRAGSDTVRDIDDVQRRMRAEQHALHHADERVRQPEVGEQRDQAARRLHQSTGSGRQRVMRRGQRPSL